MTRNQCICPSWRGKHRFASRVFVISPVRRNHQNIKTGHGTVIGARVSLREVLPKQHFRYQCSLTSICTSVDGFILPCLESCPQGRPQRWLNHIRTAFGSIARSSAFHRLVRSAVGCQRAGDGYAAAAARRTYGSTHTFGAGSNGHSATSSETESRSELAGAFQSRIPHIIMRDRGNLPVSGRFG